MLPKTQSLHDYNINGNNETLNENNKNIQIINEEEKMSTVNLEFKTDDVNLNLKGTVNFRREMPMENLLIGGLAEWRHVPANIIHINPDTIEALNLSEHASKFSKIGINYIGIRARTNILLSHAVRSPRAGLQKVQDQLTKFFKAIGATSVKFSVVDVNRALNDERNEDDEDDA